MAEQEGIGDFRATGDQLRELLERRRAALVKVMRHAFARDGIRWQREMQRRVTGPYVAFPDRKDPGARLARRTGNLARAFFARVEGSTLDDLTLRKGVSGPSARYARTHELGTKGAGGKLDDIVPVRRRWLAIPVGEALTGSGVPRRHGPRAYDDLVFVPSRRDPEGTAFLMPARVRFGAGDQAEEGLGAPLFILKKRVAIPRRLGMREVHIRHARERLADIRKGVQEALTS